MQYDPVAIIGRFATESEKEPEEATIRRLCDLKNYGDDDPNGLLGNRYLARQGGMLFVAPTGTGKSTAMIQMALLWAIGKKAFDIEPRGKIRTLIIQAENDDGDLAEMRDGVLTGMTHGGLMTDEEACEAEKNVYVVRDVVSTGDSVGEAMDRYIRESQCDLVVLDPVFSYIGGETNSAKDVGHFLRNVINPVLLRHNVGFIAVHHSNKPLAGQQKQDWQAGDFAYLGAGSAEFANWARAVLAIRSMGSHDIYQLVAGKRGKRIGWRDPEDGSKVFHKFIKHASEGICWLEASKADVDAARSDSNTTTDRDDGVDIQAAVAIAIERVRPVALLRDHLKSELGVGSRRVMDDLIKSISASPVVGRGRYWENGVQNHIIGLRSEVENILENLGVK